jgi:PPP family 3-phenylpropionic acid transporter
MNLADHRSRQNLKSSLRLVTALFFLMYAATGIYFTYIAVYWRSRGMTGTQIGIITMAGGIVAFLASTLWGYWSDRSGKPRILLAIAAAGTALSVLLIPSFPGFIGFLILGSIFPFFNVAILTLMDSTLLALLGENRADYGRYRLGGTFGYIATTLTAGIIFRELNLAAMFPFFALISGTFAILALFLPDFPVMRGKVDRSPRALISMIRTPAWAIFSTSIFLVWLAGSGGIGFLGITLKTMGASDILIGIVASSAAVFEIPFMVFNGWFLRKLGSQRMLMVSLLGYVVRIGAYSLMPTPEWGIAVNALNGLSYVWLWNASIHYANELAPENLKASAQGLFVSITALSAVASAPLSGFLFDAFGPPGMFRVLAFSAFLSAIIFWLGNRVRLAAPVYKILRNHPDESGY